MRKKVYAAGMTLREYREARGLTLTEMAAMVGCSISGLSMIERGLRRPTYDLTQKIVSATGHKVRARDLHPEAA